MPSGSARRPPAVRPAAVYATVYATVVMSNLDLFVVNVALPDIGRGFHGTGLSLLSWVLNAYAIVFAALLVPAGRLADRRGRRLGFLAGLALFTGSSVLCAAAPSAGWLIAARVLQAVGAAALLPTSLALLLEITPAQRRGRVVRAWSAIGGVSAALGPVAGGLLVQADWRWVFLINVPVGLAALAAGIRVLPRDGAQPGPRPDLLGALLLTAAIAGLALGLVQGGAWGWGSARITGCLAAAPVLLGLFLARSARHRAPVIELPMLRVGAFGAATVATLLFAVCFAGMILSTSLWCQDAWGYSPLRTGLALAPGPLMVPPLAAAAGPLGRRFGQGPVAALGNLLFGAGLLYMGLRAGFAADYPAELLPGFLIGGVGVGLALPTLTAAGATALPPERLATGTGILTMTRQIGAVLGVAVAVLVTGSPRSAQATETAFRHGWYAMAGFGALAALASLAVRRRHSEAGTGAGAAAPAADPAHQATDDAALAVRAGGPGAG
ncbi:MAG TPA: MFS transporter [Actinocrinis sp.]